MLHTESQAEIFSVDRISDSESALTSKYLWPTARTTALLSQVVPGGYS